MKKSFKNSCIYQKRFVPLQKSNKKWLRIKFNNFKFSVMKRQILFSNEPLEITDEWRKEFFESTGHEGTDEEINEYYAEYIDDFLANMQYAKDKDGNDLWGAKVVISGTLGLWDGKKTIVPEVAKDFEHALWLCIDNADYCKVYKEYSKIIIETTHHDGTNVFTLQFLTEDAEMKYNYGADLKFTNRRNLRTLGKYLF